MRRTKNIYLGISPSSKYIGFAVIKNGELIDWFVKSFPGKWSQEKLQTIKDSIQCVTQNYRVTEVCIKVPDVRRQSKALKQILRAISMVAVTAVNVYTIQEIKKRIKCKNKKELIKFLFKLYPELQNDSEMGTYHSKIFEALGSIISNKS